MASTAKRQAKRVASTAAQRGQEVVQATAGGAKSVVGTVKAAGAEVVEQGSTEARSLVEDARSQLQSQAATQLQRLAERLGDLGEETMALTDGRSEEAATLRPYMTQAADALLGAADIVYAMADEVEVGGFGGVLEEVERFGRRRPGVFLLGAAVAGFGVGRVVRARRADDQDAPADDALTPSRGAAGATRSGARPAARPPRSRTGAESR